MTSILRQIVNESNKPYLADYNIQVTGHTDSIGSSSHNQNLSERRASNVLQKMITLGSAQNKLSSIGLGDSTPKYFGEQDRRTDLLSLLSFFFFSFFLLFIFKRQHLGK